MSLPKPALQSRTIQGALAGALAGACLLFAPQFGVELSTEVRDALLAVVLTSFGVTALGRQRAAQPLTWRRK